jgi:hypothetical protein
MDKDWIGQFDSDNAVSGILDTNEYTARFGLALSKEDAQKIVASRKTVLRQQGRVEFGKSVTDAVIKEFCDSQYIGQDNYTETVIRLQEIFFTFKNEMMDQVSDDELLHFMREQFDGVCAGDLDYLEETVLPTFAQAVRRGYDGYKATDGYGEYEKFDEVKRWDPELYQEVLRDLGLMRR